MSSLTYKKHHLNDKYARKGLSKPHPHRKHHKIAIAVFIIALLFAFPYQKALTFERYARAGELAEQTVIAPFKIEIFKDDSTFQKDVRQAEAAVTPVFRKDIQSAKSVTSILESILHNITILQNTNPKDSLSQKSIEHLSQYYSTEEIISIQENKELFTLFFSEIKSALSNGILSHVLAENQGKLEQYREKFDGKFRHTITTSSEITILSGQTEQNFPRSKLVTIPDLYLTLFDMITGSTDEKTYLASALYTTFDVIVKPTLIYDAKKTDILRSEARMKIKPILRTIPRNVEIVRKNQLVTALIEENLSALQRQHHVKYAASIAVKSIISQSTTLLLLFGLSLILIRSLFGLVPQGIARVTYFNTLAMIMVASFIIIRIGALIMSSLAPDVMDHSSAIVYTAVPMVIGSLIAAALFNKETGFILTVFFSVYGGILGNYNPIIPLGVLISGGIVSGLAASLRYRRDFLLMVVWVALTNLLIGVTMTFVDGTDPTVNLFAKIILFSVANAIATIAFSFLLLPIFEQHFHLTTDMTLMELADMNHPLLKRLAIEAPGTYNHSIMVANLAEAAANAIGADGLLCRVVSYYHDIGKLKKPQNFIENQFSKRNVHDMISPSMSVRIIAGHIREGLELAEEYKLPQAIKDVIPQHHGDGPISFFYQKALEEKSNNSDIDIRDYSYGGPKPQTRENAVVMIADSVEAASRTLKGVSLKDVREVVKKIIWGKISHNQLDECGLTLSDLSEITNGMMPILEGVFHSRIEYPEEEELENGEVQA